jgi:hypothetical protein
MLPAVMPPELSLVNFEIKVLQGAVRQVREYAEHHNHQSERTLEMMNELLKNALARREQLWNSTALSLHAAQP